MLMARADLGDDRGAIAVMVAIVLPLMVLVLSFGIDTANWWVHKRHLQTQADAGALAAGAVVQKGCTQPAVQSMAQTYALSLNPQLGHVSGSNVALKLNSATYDGQTTPTDTTVKTGDPCSVDQVDVKLTEHNLPFWFQKLGIVDNINAHARVDVKQIGTSKGQLPLAFRNATFAYMAYQLFDEDTGASIGTVHQLTADSTGLFTEPDASISTYAVSQRHIGVRIAGSISGPIPVDGSGNMSCPSSVDCYEPGTPGANGLTFIRGFSATTVGATDAPQVRTAFLDPALQTCGVDPYFTDTRSAGCAVALRANVAWNPGVQDTATIGSAAPPARIWATVGGTNYPMYKVGGGVATEVQYETGTFANQTGVTPAATIPVALAAGGAIPISMGWEQAVANTKAVVGGTVTDCSNGGNNKCTGSFEGGKAVQFVYAANDAGSGPITQVMLWEHDDASGVNNPAAHSFQVCDATHASCSHKFTVSVKLTDITKTTMLRANGTGSQNQSVDCGPQLSVTLATGCTTPYAAIQPGETCAIDPGPAFHCVAPSTGGKVGQITSLNTYFLHGANTCTAPNKWSTYSTGDPRMQDDPRFVKVFVTSFDSFAGQGTSTAYKVLGFAYMYVTGWQAQKNDNGDPCAAVTGQFADEPSPDPSFTKGSIWGHFVSFANRNDGSVTPGTTDCDFNNPLLGCVATLTE